MRLSLAVATSVWLASCGADPAFDQCETQRTAYTCGLTKGLVIDCRPFRGKTCDSKAMETWLRCQLAAHVNACGVDPMSGATAVLPGRLDTSKCLAPVCQGGPTPPGEPR